MHPGRIPPSASSPHHWADLGGADASLILRGQWWAHADRTDPARGPRARAGQTASSAGSFIWLASRRLGAGLAWLLTVLGGALGKRDQLPGPGIAPQRPSAFPRPRSRRPGCWAGITPFGVGRRHARPGQRQPGQNDFFRFLNSAPGAGGRRAGASCHARRGARARTWAAICSAWSPALALGIGTGWLSTRHGLPTGRTDRGRCTGWPWPCPCWPGPWPGWRDGGRNVLRSAVACECISGRYAWTEPVVEIREVNLALEGVAPCWKTSP